MDINQANSNKSSMRKRRKLVDKKNETGSSKVAAFNAPDPAVNASDPPATAVNQTGDIFKLDIDCYEEAFDYVPLEDLVNVSKTCKRLQQVAGYCFQQNYLGSAHCDSDGIQCYGVDVEHLAPFIRSIWTDADGLWYVHDARTELRRLKEIFFEGMQPVHMKYFLEIPMQKLEYLQVIHCELSEKLNEVIVHCPKLKRLIITSCTGSFSLINRKYPTLEYFKIDDNKYKWVKGIPTFLKLNPNIRKFAASEDVIWNNRNKFISGNIKLDNLAIYLCSSPDDDNYKPVRNLLNALHDRGFYKKLQLYLSIKNQEEIDQLVNIKGLVKLHVGSCYNENPIAFSALKNLEELYAEESAYIADLNILVDNLLNLKRIHFNEASFDEIMPFIRQSARMQIIEVTELKSGINFNEDTNVINLLTLNQERKQLPNAQKITLFVDDRIYLATKWAMKETDLDLIRSKRVESFDWDHDFY